MFRKASPATLMALSLASLAATAACDPAATDSDVAPIAGPGAGKADGNLEDIADHSCQVVLRAARPQFAVDENDERVCGRFGCYLLVDVDVHEDHAASAGFEGVYVGFTDGNGWYSAPAYTSSGAADGYQRYTATVPVDSDHLELIPYTNVEWRGVQFRTWDHNVHADAAANYPAGKDVDYTIVTDASVCSGETAEATIRFADDWSETVEGELRGGGKVTIDYDLDRLPECRGRKYGQPAWSLVAYVQFDGGEVASQPVAVADYDARENVQQLVTFDVPAGAAQMKAWFHNADYWACHAWDSNYGANYVFDVE